MRPHGKQYHEPYFHSEEQKKELPQSHPIAGTTLMLIPSLQNHYRQVFSLSYKLLSLANHFHVPVE